MQGNRRGLPTGIVELRNALLDDVHDAQEREPGSRQGTAYPPVRSRCTDRRPLSLPSREPLTRLLARDLPGELRIGDLLPLLLEPGRLRPMLLDRLPLLGERRLRRLDLGGGPVLIPA